MISELVTERLLLRRWRHEDREPFLRMCQDAEVMRYLLPMNDRTASDAFIDRLNTHFEMNGFGMWAAERRSSSVSLVCSFRVFLSHRRRESRWVGGSYVMRGGRASRWRGRRQQPRRVSHVLD